MWALFHLFIAYAGEARVNEEGRAVRLPSALASLLRRRLLFVCLFAALLVAYVLGGLTGLDNLLTSSRFKLARSDASQNLVLVEIDSRSLAALDAWPWPRSYHAALIERLTEAGAVSVALNIDFSARSSAEEDGQLARALANTPSKVVLPVFRQISSRAGGEDHISLVGPITSLRENALPGSVNVIADSDGVIRRHNTKESWNDNSVTSMAALLANISQEEGDIFQVDYGIRAGSIPVYSYADIYLEKIDPALLAGKTVLIGASAAELGARFTVPSYGTVPGTIVHALAYESLVQGRMLQQLPTAAVAAIGLILAIAFFALFSATSWRRGAGILFAALALVYFTALGVQAWSPTLIDAGFWMLCLVAAYLSAIARGIDQQAYRFFIQDMAFQHRREMMDAVLDNNFHGIVITDAEGRIQFFNKAAAILFNCEREQVLRQPFEQIVPWINSLQTVSDEEAGKNDGMPAAQHPVEKIFVDKDGVATSLEVILNESSLGIGVNVSERRKRSRKINIYTFRNIEPRKRLELAQEKALDEAISAGRSKAEFLAIMSHELRTPLNAIIGFSDILRNQIFGPIGSQQYLEYANDIHQSGAGLLTLINDILNVSRVEAGKFSIEDSVIRLPEVLAPCLNLLRGLATEKSVQLTAEIPDGLPQLRVDERLLKQMMINIISNAVKFTEAGGEIHVGAHVDGAGRYLIETTDNGIGMAEEDIPKALEPFQQADGSLDRKYEGSGLGLYLVSKFVGLHGGSVELESAVDEGMMVRLCFPPERVVASKKSSHATD